MVGGVAGVFGNVASGGLFGLIGSLAGAGLKFLERKQQAVEKAAERAHELRLLEAQRAAKAEETEQDLAIAQSQGSWAGLAASQAITLPASDVPPWANAVRALYRPALTTGLVVVVYLIFLEIMSGLRGGPSALIDVMSAGELKTILAYLIHSVTFAAVTAVVWWFGDRAFTPPGLKHR